jgi:hypothetical protein
VTVKKTAGSRTFNTYNEYLAWVRGDTSGTDRRDGIASRIVDRAIEATRVDNRLPRAGTSVPAGRQAFDKRTDGKR